MDELIPSGGASQFFYEQELDSFKELRKLAKVGIESGAEART
ncbi:MAG: hypothetical protein ACREN8_13915 [Candidatus Dormibacteraceae bacterium]